MGQVFLAHDPRLMRDVAVKRLHAESRHDPKKRSRFRREARSAAKLNHPNIVTIHDLIFDEAGECIIMEWVAGQPLAGYLEAGPLPTPNVLAIVSQIVEALDFAHTQHVVHRDLKAANVMLSDRGHVKVLDFGLAKPLDGAGFDPTTLTLEGQLLGTPSAMSPEQALGREVDSRSDFFSLGSLLYEMLTGNPPFLGVTVSESLLKVISHEPPPIRELVPDIPAPLSLLIENLLQKEPAHRPSSALAIAEAMRQITRGSESSGTEASISATEATLSDTEAAISATTTYDALLSTPAISRKRPSDPDHVEKRHVTLICGELLNVKRKNLATEPSDPESLFASLKTFEPIFRRVVTRHKGLILERLSHRFIICFGYPHSQEEDSIHAATAAQEMLEGLSENQDLAQQTLRMSLHTGEMVAPSSPNDLATTPFALDRTLDLGLILLGETTPGTITVSAATRKLVARTFNLKDGPVLTDLRFDGSIASSVLLEPRDESGFWQAEDSLAPLVARRTELDFLLKRWEQVRGGQGQVISIGGEAGIGKSRLVMSFLGQFARPPEHQIIGGARETINAPLHPILKLLWRMGRSLLKRTLDTEGLVEISLRLELPPEETVPFLALILQFPPSKRYPLPVLSPEAQRQRTHEAILIFLLQAAQHQPMVIVIEDLHWIDPSTHELLETLINEMVDVPLLLVLTHRSEMALPWNSRPHISQLSLGRLSAPEIARLAKSILGREEIPDEVLEQIRKKSDGIPLFVEELTKLAAETGLIVAAPSQKDFTGKMMPSTLRESLMARLDRLGAAKDIAQVAAVIGREFTHRLLSAVTPHSEASLEEGLRLLVKAELIRKKGFASRRRYIFHHALIQDAAYESILSSTRATLHRNVGRTLESEFPSFVENQPESLAFHFERGQEPGKSSQYYRDAGLKASNDLANVEALQYFRKALAILQEHPDEEERNRQELTLQIELSNPLVATEGFGSGSLRTFERTLELCRSTGETRKEFLTTYRIWSLALNRDLPEMTVETSRKLDDFHTRHVDSLTEIDAAAVHLALGITDFYRGDLRQAVATLKNVSPEFLPVEAQREIVGDFYVDIYQHAALYLMWALVLTGQILELEDWLVKADAYRSQLPSIHEGGLLAFLSGLDFDLGQDVETSRITAQRGVELNQKHGLLFYEQLSRIYLHITLIRGGSRTEITPLEEALAVLRTIDAGLVTPLSEARIAKALLDRGEVAEAKPFVLRAAGALEKGLNRIFDAEIQRVEAEQAWRCDSDWQRAEAGFDAASQLAEHQGAELFCLRIATSRLRMMQSTGRADHSARQHLLETLRRFETGLGPQADLERAASLCEDYRQARALADA